MAYLILGFASGLILFLMFDFIDYYWFDHIMRKRVFPNSNDIIVLDDEETWSGGGFYIKVSDQEKKSLMDGYPLKDLIDEERWRVL